MFVSVDNIIATEKQLTIDYTVMVLHDRRFIDATTVGLVGEEWGTQRQLTIPYNKLHLFEYSALDNLTQEKVNTLLLLPPNINEYALGPYGDLYRNPESVQPEYPWDEIASGEIESERDSSATRPTLGLFDYSSSDCKTIVRLLKKGFAFTGSTVVLSHKGKVYAISLPQRCDTHLWAVPARITLYPFAVIHDFVLKPAVYVAVFAPMIGVVLIAENPQLLYSLEDV